jgi:hypothetical protein
VPVRLLVQHQVAVGDTFDIDYATDLSRGGLFIETRKPFAPDSTVHVQFAPGRDSQLVSAFCRVTHVSARGIGAEFVSLDAESAYRIATALREPPNRKGPAAEA